MVRALTAIRGGWRGRAAKVLTVAAAGLALYVAAGMGLPATAQALDAGERQRLAEALRAMDRDEWRWARKTVDGFGFRPLATYARWRELLEGDPKPGFAAYADFLARHRDWPSLGTLRTRAEEQIDEAVPHRDRLAFFQGGRQQPLTRQGRIRYAQALLEAGRRAEAAEVLRQSWVLDDFPRSEEEYFLGLYREYLLAADHERRLSRLLWDGEVTSAQRLLPLVRKDLQLLATARIRLQGLEKKAVAAFDAVPPGLRADAGLLYDRLRWARRRGQRGGGGRGPAARAAEPGPARAVVARAAPRDSRAARLRCRRPGLPGGQGAPAARGVPFAEAEWLAGWIALRFLKDPAAARRHFERLSAGVASQISRGRAAYWAARAAESAGDRAGAREWYRRASGYPSTFYGQLAAQKTGVRLPALMPLRARATEGARERMRRRDSAAVAQALCRLDGVGADAALPFFRHLGHEAADDPDELRAVAELGAGCGRPDLVVVAAKAAAKEGAEPDPDTAFPVPAVRGLRALDGSLPDPALRIAIARQESQFDPRAGSPAGALGMMQLMPATAKAVSERSACPTRRPASCGTPSTTSAWAAPTSRASSTGTTGRRSWRSPPTTPAPAGCRSGYARTGTRAAAPRSGWSTGSR
jgi:soluble lytic murein transglycosylase